MSAALSIVPSLGAGSATDDPTLLGKLIRDFEFSEEVTWKGRELSERDRDFRDGNQLTKQEIEALHRRRQPPSVNNYIGRKVDLLCGMERRGRSDPKAFPRTPANEDHATAVTQALRYVADENRFDVIRSQVYENMLVEGYGGAEVIVEPATVSNPKLQQTTSLAPQQPDFDVIINYIPWDRLFYDPHSRDPGFYDAGYKGVVLWMDRTEALERWPGSEAILEASYVGMSASQTYDDKPRWATTWADSKRTRVRIVQMHYKRGGDWWTATFTRGGFLEAPAPSPYLDRHGRTACPLIMRSAYVDRENNRYGIVRSMISMQEAINKRESKLLHLLNVNQIIMDEGAVDDVDHARAEAAKPDGVIIKRPSFEFEIRRDQSEISGHFELLQYNVAQMNANGPNAAMSGKDPREQSGRAIIAQQAGGAAESEPLADSLRQWTHKIYEAAWMRFRQYVNSERLIRVTGSDQGVQFLALNHPVTLQEELQSMDPAQVQQIAARMQLQPNDPRLQQIVRIQNDVDDMDVDITVEEGPDVPTMQFESWQAFMQLPQPVLVNFPPQFFIEFNPALNSDDKTKATDMLKQAEQQKAAMAQQQQATQQAMQQATIADKQAQANLRQADTVARYHKVAVEHGQATQPQTTLSMEQAPPDPMMPPQPQQGTPQ